MVDEKMGGIILSTIEKVGVLNEIAAQYTNPKYVQSTRYMGYDG